MPRVQKIRRVVFNDEEIGMGFDTETGETLGTALQDFTVNENKHASGQQVSGSVLIIHTFEDLMSSLNLSFEAEGRYGMVSGSAKAKYAEQSRYNSTSTFVVASSVVENSLRRGRDFKVKPEAQALIDAHQTERFKGAFGDSFVRGLQTGGEFYAVVRITSVSESTQKELAVELQLEAQGLVASGSFQAKFSNANSSSTSKSEYQATIYQAGGSGDPTPVEISEVVARYQKFPQIAKDHAWAYETEIASYQTLPLDIPTPEETENFLLSLADARSHKLRYIELRNDIQLAIDKREFFESLPPDSELINYISAYTQLINAVMRHATRVARAEIEPSLFDPSLLTPPLVEPEALTLVRRPAAIEIPAEEIAVFPLIGVSGQTLESIWSLLGHYSVDEVAADKNSIDQGYPPIPRDRNLVEFISKVQLIFEPMPGVDPQLLGPVVAVMPPVGTKIPVRSPVTVIHSS